MKRLNKKLLKDILFSYLKTLNESEYFKGTKDFDLNEINTFTAKQLLFIRNLTTASRNYSSNMTRSIGKEHKDKLIAELHELRDENRRLNKLVNNKLKIA